MLVRRKHFSSPRGRTHEAHRLSASATVVFFFSCCLLEDLAGTMSGARDTSASCGDVNNSR